MEIEVAESIQNRVNKMRLCILHFQADVSDSSDDLWEKMEMLIELVQSNYQLENISKNESISEAREAYKRCGKDPNRYRPSADSLIRRIVKNRGLYKVNNVVDILNYVSIQSGISIGGYDVNNIIGKIKLDIGNNTDNYNGIGRGELNIVGMPCLRDNIGVFGTPTSDSQRTMITENTKNISFVFFDFGYRTELFQDFKLTSEMLIKYANASDLHEYLLEM